MSKIRTLVLTAALAGAVLPGTAGAASSKECGGYKTAKWATLSTVVKGVGCDKARSLADGGGLRGENKTRKAKGFKCKLGEYESSGFKSATCTKGAKYAVFAIQYYDEV